MVVPVEEASAAEEGSVAKGEVASAEAEVAMAAVEDMAVEVVATVLSCWFSLADPVLISFQVVVVGAMEVAAIREATLAVVGVVVRFPYSSTGDMN